MLFSSISYSPAVGRTVPGLFYWRKINHHLHGNRGYLYTTFTALLRGLPTSTAGPHLPLLCTCQTWSGVYGAGVCRLNVLIGNNLSSTVQGIGTPRVLYNSPGGVVGQ